MMDDHNPVPHSINVSPNNYLADEIEIDKVKEIDIIPGIDLAKLENKIPSFNTNEVMDTEA